MDSPDIKLCMGCMREKQDDEAVCPFCGFDVKTPHHPLYLKPGTLVSKQYIVGKLISCNGEGATYLGYNLAQNNKVLIREYMPDALAVREPGGERAVTLKGKETQYKALLSDFGDLCRQLQKLRTYTGLLSLTDFFEHNNTAYAVYHFVAETTLTSFFKMNGNVAIETLKERLAPILAAVEAMHALGVIHRGISPETILVTEDTTLRLFGFCIPAARTAKCELAAELFAGYSPPELYSLTGWQGTWTDVYSIAAVIYTALTGIVPPEAPARLTGDTLKPASEVNPAVPEFISRVLQQAMALEPKERPQTIGEFSMALTLPAAPSEAITENSDKRGENVYQEQPAQKKSAHKWKVRKRNFVYTMSSMLITTAVLLTLMFVILSEMDSSLLVFAKDNTPGTSIIDVTSDATASEAPYLLPNFVGSYLDSVKSKEDYQKKYVVNDSEEYNDEYPAGVIIEQNPLPDTPVTEMVNVAVKVSKGAAPIPDGIVGMAQADAEQALADLNIKCQVVQMYDDTVPAGNIIKVTRLPGEVMLFVSQGSMSGGTTSNGIIPEGWTTEEYQEWFKSLYD